MRNSVLLDRYLEKLLEGDRRECRTLVWEAMERDAEPERVYFELLWPAMEQVQQMYREDGINTASEHMATRINRALADQVQRELPRRQHNGKRIVVASAPGESEELGAPDVRDLFEARGWNVCFVGGGVPPDEILSLAGQLRPDILLIYGMTSHGVPDVRATIDLIRDVDVNPTMNILVAGGVFNRAEGLWKEINADLHAPDIEHALDVAETAIPRAGAAHPGGTQAAPPAAPPATAGGDAVGTV